MIKTKIALTKSIIRILLGVTLYFNSQYLTIQPMKKQIIKYKLYDISYVV